MPEEPIAIGTAGSGPLAHVEAGGALRRPDGSTLRWWVLAEDRLHRPEHEPAVRRQLVGDAPVVRTSLRVPGGDVEATTFAAVPAGGGAPVAVVELHNATPVPVAVALVADAGPDWSLDRAPSGSARVDDLDAAAAAVEGRAVAPSPAEGALRVVWLPVPHSQGLRVVWAPGIDPAAVPPVDAVVAGWSRQVGRGVRLELDEPSVTTAWERDRRRLVLGELDPSTAALAGALGALVRLGWFDDAVATTELLAARRHGDGSFGRPGEDRVDATLAVVGGLGSWCRAGLPADRLEEVSVTVGDAAAWLTARRRRRALGARGPAGRRALEAAACLLEVAGHAEAAVRARTDAGRLPEGPGEASPGGDTPAIRLSTLLDGMVSEECGPVELLRAAGPGWRGRSVEVHDAPVVAGRCSFALRWHGERPAILWEVEPWPGLAGPPPDLSAPALDPSWRGSGWSGEALLAAPAGS